MSQPKNIFFFLVYLSFTLELLFYLYLRELALRRVEEDEGALAHELPERRRIRQLLEVLVGEEPAELLLLR